jgi:hypothetical protein
MIKKFLFILLYSCYLLCSLFPLDAGGSVEMDYYGLIDEETFYTNERIRITSFTEIAEREKGNWYTFCLSFLFYFQPIGEPEIIDVERIIREAYAGFYYGIFDIYIGQKFVNHGKVDILSPLNVINHSDTHQLSMDNFFESSIPDILAQVIIYPADFLSLDFVYVPFFQPDLYSIDNIQIERSFTLQGPIKPEEFNIDASFINRRVPPFSQWAHSVHIAVNFTSNLFDLILAYSYYIDQMLDFDTSDLSETIVEGPSLITHTIEGTVYPGYSRVHNIGLGTSFYLFDYLISADASIKLTPDTDGSRMEIRNNEIFYTFQIEKIFFANLKLQTNFFHRIILNAGADITSDYSPQVQNFLEGIFEDYMLQKPESQIYILFHADTNFFRETFFIGANFIYGFEEPEHAFYFAPRVSFVLNDYVSLSAGADFWWGGIEEGFLGRNAELDNFYIRMKVVY